jgi:hypothetical protein
VTSDRLNRARLGEAWQRRNRAECGKFFAANAEAWLNISNFKFQIHRTLNSDSH